MKIDDCTIAKIKDRAESILEHYGVTLKRGAGLCPFHEDKNASFAAKRDKAGELYWKCMACGVEGGDILSFVAQIERLDAKRDFRKVVEKAAGACGLSYLLSDVDIEPTQLINPIEKKKKPQVFPKYINAELLSPMCAEVEHTNLFSFLSGIWGMDDVRRVMDAYRVGLYAGRIKQNPDGSKYTIDAGGVILGCASCSAFPSIDTDGNIHSIKSIPYPINDHHRIKGDGKCMDWNKGESVTGAYFGSHLLPLYPGKRVALVESEKTAIVGMLYAPQYVWIAVQGMQFFKPHSEATKEKCNCMKGRTIHVFPDSDGLVKWREAADYLAGMGFNVIFRDEVISRFTPDSKTDIADVIIRAKLISTSDLEPIGIEPNCRQN